MVEQAENGWWYGELEDGTQGWFALQQAPYKKKEIIIKTSAVSSAIFSLQQSLAKQGNPLFKEVLNKWSS